MAELRTIVTEEIAGAIRDSFFYFMRHGRRDTASDAKRLVDTLSGSLDDLGLAIRNPKTGEPMLLAMARTPPQAGESWLELQPIKSGSSTIPLRLPDLMREVPIALCPAPPSESQRKRSLGR